MEAAATSETPAGASTVAESACTPPPAPPPAPMLAVVLEPAVFEAPSTPDGTGRHVAPNT